jgi:hypothetical protein
MKCIGDYHHILLLNGLLHHLWLLILLLHILLRADDRLRLTEHTV